MKESERDAHNGTVYAKIQDINTRESELNKQVFALLILQRFVSDNPMENQAAADVSNTARQSVSRIMTDQLNRMSRKCQRRRAYFRRKIVRGLFYRNCAGAN